MTAKKEKPSLNIYQRINKIMEELSYVQKEDKKVNGQYTFVSHDAVAAKVHPLLVEHGVVIIPTVEKHFIEGNRTTAIVKFSFINIDEPTDRFESYSVGFGIDNQDKGIGKAVSYAKKYVCLQTFMLETGDDPDRDLIDYEPETISEVQVAEIKQLINETNSDEKLFYKHFEIDALENLPICSFDKAVNSLNTKKERANANT
tara:strand:- start:608 stop:1213 length:606 start_codon:yes stop_codon:yes gene_type:complete